MSELTIFKSKADLSHFKNNIDSEFDSICSYGERVPRIRLDGKEFVLHEEGEIISLGKKIQCVIVSVGGENPSKCYYKDAFEGGSVSAPTCMSCDGIRPDSGASEPQSDVCATCDQNVWGSKIGLSGGKAQACRSYRRLALHVKINDEYDIYRLDVRSGSLSSLSAYAKQLKILGAPVNGVYTEITFDKAAKYPKFTFDAISSLNEKAYEFIRALKDDSRVVAIKKDAYTGSSDSDSNSSAVLKVEPAALVPAKAKKPAKAKEEATVEVLEAPKAIATVKAATAADFSADLDAMLAGGEL